MGLSLLVSHDSAVGTLGLARVVPLKGVFFFLFLAKIYNHTVRYYTTHEYVFLNVSCTSAAAACIHRIIVAELLALLLVVIECLVTQCVLRFVSSDFSVPFSSFEDILSLLYSPWLYCRVYRLDLYIISMHGRSVICGHARSQGGRQPAALKLSRNTWCKYFIKKLKNVSCEYYHVNG